MRMCKEHWDMCRDAIEQRGMSGLIAKDGKTVVDDTMADLHGEPDPEHKRFDPLMSMNWHWTNNALQAGGLYLMGETEDGSNDGHYCPICEYTKNLRGFDAARDIGFVADQMQAFARAEGLIPPVA